jgi:hypothetical protein
MSYTQVQQLATDIAFQNRVAACMWNQAPTYQNDADPPSAAMAQGIMRGNTPALIGMVNMMAAFPGMLDGAVVITKGDGSQMLDQTAIPDEAILGQVQANWKTVAGLFYSTSPPIPPA